MTSLTFTLVSEPPERLDLSPLTPQGLAGLSRRAIEQTRLGLSKRGARVGDLFRLSGEDAESIVFAGGSVRFDCLGAGMTEGAIRVTGEAGAQAGRKMSGGLLTIEGSAGPHAGSGMTGGRLDILGDAGDFAGGPLTGEMRGMNGGVLVIR
ncbi:formylmethanofuran dehydrogenase subunit C, partial [Nitratireductor sp. GCM10026969]